MEPLRIVYEDATSRQVYSGNLHIVAWFDAPNGEQMREFGQRAEILRERHPGGTGLLNLVVRGTPRFDADVRDAAREYTQRSFHRVGAAHVILVEGLLAAAVRGFLSTMVLLGRPENPTKVFGAIDDAARWMAESSTRLGDERWDRWVIEDLCRRTIAR